MRILHIIQRFWPAIGGAEGHLAELSYRLAAAGHQVTVLTTDALDFELFWDPRRRRVDRPTDWHRNVLILRCPVRHLPLPQVSYPAWRRLLWTLSRAGAADAAALLRLARFTPWIPDLWHWLETTAEPFDLVAGMTICFEPLLDAGLRFARRRGIPFVAYPLTHLGAGPAPGRDPVSSFYTMRHQVASVVGSDAAVLQTPTEWRFYVERGLSPNRAFVAGPGVDPAEVLGGDAARLRAAQCIAGPLVLALGSMSYDKGTVHVVEAARRLWQDGQAFELALAGALLAPFRRYLERLPAADRQRIRVLGAVDEPTKRDLLAAADVVAMPSRTDSFGITYLEAWLYGKPVIGAQAWGVADVIQDGVDGVLVPFGDVPALACALAYLLAHPDEAQAMGRRGRDKVYAHHLWEHKYAITRALYGQLVAG